MIYILKLRIWISAYTFWKLSNLWHKHSVEPIDFCIIELQKTNTNWRAHAMNKSIKQDDQNGEQISESIKRFFHRFHISSTQNCPMFMRRARSLWSRYSGTCSFWLCWHLAGRMGTLSFLWTVSCCPRKIRKTISMMLPESIREVPVIRDASFPWKRGQLQCWNFSD